MLKAILATLTGFGSDKTALEAAFALARIDAGHVEALHVRTDAAQLAAIAQVAAMHVYGALQDTARDIGKQEYELSRAARLAYDEACARHLKADGAGKGTASFLEVTTLSNETLHRARIHDFTVTARVPELAPERLADLVMFAGKPIIVAPARPPRSLGEIVAIAWKDTPEAARAVTAALPILERARQVIVIAVCESRVQQDAEQAAAEGLVALLKRHGISAPLRFSPAAPASAAEKLKEIVYDANADLLVMGAYGHSRVRELILGGVTRALLADCDIALMLAH